MRRLVRLIFICLTLFFDTRAQEKFVSHYAGMVVSPDNAMGHESIAKTPTGISADTNGNIFFSDAGNCVIRKIDGATSKLFTKVGTNLCGNNGDGLPGTSTMIGRVGNIFVDSSGQIYWPEMDNGLVRVFNTVGFVETLVGSLSTSIPSDNVPCQNTGLNNPRAVWVDSSGNIYIADTNNSRVRKCNSLVKTIETVAGSALTSDSGDSGPATSAGLSLPNDIQGDTSGNLYIACSASIHFVDGGTGIITTLISGLSNAQGIYYQISSGSLFIAESGTFVIKKRSSSGIITAVVGTGSAGKSIDSAYAITTPLGIPADVFVDENNIIYFTESLTGYVSVCFEGGRLYHYVGPSLNYGKYVGDGYDATLAFLSQPNQIWGDTMGTLYLADGGNGLIRKITTSNIISSLGNASGAFSFKTPYGVYGDTSNHLYVSDFAASVLYKITLSPTVTRQVYSGRMGIPDCRYNVVAGDSYLVSPASLWIDELGEVYLADVSCGILRYNLSDYTSRILDESADSYGITGNSQYLFVANSVGNTILEIDRVTHSTQIIAGNGMSDYEVLHGGELATQVPLNSPAAITIDRFGNLYIIDQQSLVIRMIYKTSVSGSDYYIKNILGDNVEYIGGTPIEGRAEDVRMSTSTGMWANTNGDVYLTTTFIVPLSFLVAFTLLSLIFGQIKIHPKKKKNDTSIHLKVIPVQSSSGATSRVTDDMIKLRSYLEKIDEKSDVEAFDLQKSDNSESVTSFQSFSSYHSSNSSYDSSNSSDNTGSIDQITSPLNQRTAATPLPVIQRSTSVMSFTSLEAARRRLDTDVSMLSLRDYFGPDDDDSSNNDGDDQLVSAEELREDTSVLYDHNNNSNNNNNEDSESTMSSELFESQMEDWMMTMMMSSEYNSNNNSRRNTSSRLRLRSRGMSNMSNKSLESGRHHEFSR
eukprot:gene11735-12806_t